VYHHDLGELALKGTKNLRNLKIFKDFYWSCFLKKNKNFTLSKSKQIILYIGYGLT